MLGLQVQPVNIKFTEQGPTSLFRALREPSCCLSKHNLAFAHVGAHLFLAIVWRLVPTLAIIRFIRPTNRHLKTIRAAT